MLRLGAMKAIRLKNLTLMPGEAFFADLLLCTEFIRSDFLAVCCRFGFLYEKCKFAT